MQDFGINHDDPLTTRSPKDPAAQSTFANVASAPKESKENSLASSVAPVEPTADYGGVTDPDGTGLVKSSAPATDAVGATDQTLQMNTAKEATASSTNPTFVSQLVFNTSSMLPQTSGE